LLTDDPDLNALAAQCEAAHGPDRGLDLSVHKALEQVRGGYGADDVGTPVLKKSLRTGRPYTGSVAAALAPVPQGAWWEAVSEGTGHRAWVQCGDHVQTASGRTVPLAILGAALRALAAFVDAKGRRASNLQDPPCGEGEK
jgi:hypothetical protein